VSGSRRGGRCAREWRRRWEAGDRDLEHRSSVASSIPGRTPVEVEEAVCALPDLRFSATRIAEALGMSERTARAVLAPQRPVAPASPRR
jgi:hypothetical protein